jgi:3-dehydrosphinganine reductase
MYQDRNIIVTGGSSGIGEALAHGLAQRGARLALIARDPGKLGRVQAELLAASPGATVKVFPCDVADEGQVEATMAAVADQLGPPAILINSAGVLIADYFDCIPSSEFRRIIDINLMGTVNTVRHALPRMRSGCRIVNISSMAGVLGVFGYSAYCASKHALAGFTSTLRQELKPRGIKVHLVLPPETQTPMLDQVNEGRIPENKAMCETLPALPAAAVAKAVIKGVERDRYLIVPGAGASFMAWLVRVLPAAERLIADRIVKGAFRGPGANKGG